MLTSWKNSFGIDGIDSPAITISLEVINDNDAPRFSLLDLRYWLGYSVDDLILGRSIVITPESINQRTPSRHITENTFTIGSQQVIDYASVLTVRTGPGNHYDVLTFLTRGDIVNIVDYNGKFVQISTDHGYGWIFAGFLSRDILNFEQ